MNINTIFNNYLANGYSNLNAISKTCQDIILRQISNSNLNKNVTINDNISAPIQKGDCLGKVTYTLNNEQLLEINLLAESNIEKNTVWNLTTSLYQRWFKLLR